MKPILAIEQDPTLPGLGLLGRAVRSRALPIVSAHAWEGDLDGLRPGDFGGVVPLGGSMQSWDEAALPYLRRQREFLREAVEQGVPVLGICLGGQLLARALGAEVRPAERLEAGWLAIEPTAGAADDPLLRSLRGPVGVYHWHTDVFDLPAGSVRLARSEQSANQAFRYGERAWGLQFHPEVDAPLFAGWMQNYADAPAAVGLDRAELEAAIATGSPAFTDALFGAFCTACADAAADA
ncbi:MAG TPA: type 1 glutamine amidotransferase [Gaiellales bacterium]